MMLEPRAVARALGDARGGAERGAAVALCMAGAASLCAMVMAGRCWSGAHRDCRNRRSTSGRQFRHNSQFPDIPP